MTDDTIGFFQDAPRSRSMMRLLAFALVAVGLAIYLAGTALLFVAGRIDLATTAYAAGSVLTLQGLGFKAQSKAAETKADNVQ